MKLSIKNITKDKKYCYKVKTINLTTSGFPIKPIFTGLFKDWNRFTSSPEDVLTSYKYKVGDVCWLLYCNQLIQENRWSLDNYIEYIWTYYVVILFGIFPNKLIADDLINKIHTRNYYKQPDYNTDLICFDTLDGQSFQATDDLYHRNVTLVPRPTIIRKLKGLK